MNIPAMPHIECEQHHATLSVGDVRGAADFYANKLGFIVAFTEGDPPTGPAGWTRPLDGEAFALGGDGDQPLRNSLARDEVLQVFLRIAPRTEQTAPRPAGASLPRAGTRGGVARAQRKHPGEGTPGAVSCAGSAR
jgi:catechol 2,3-dioxygenase-like lactoylglutathione lyase family enzyme